MDRRYGVFEGTTFKRDKFAGWLIANNMPWPRLESGQPVDMVKRLLRLHRETYPVFWRWSDAAVDRAMLLGCDAI